MVEWSETDAMYNLIIENVVTGFCFEDSKYWEIMGNIHEGEV